MSSSEIQPLLRRLQAVVAKWPVDPTRKGRDLGEFLRTSYLQQFKEQAQTNVILVRTVTARAHAERGGGGGKARKIN